MTQPRPLVLIVTGEASGDMHGAKLAQSISSLRPEIQLFGMGGKAMLEAGVEIICDAEKVSVVGIFEIFSQLIEIAHAQKLLRAFLREKRPSLLIIIDLPDFNLLLAKVAKELHIPVFYYITPQVWAWRTGRVATIADRCSQLGVILPFEEEFFRKHGISARYVGHPLLDSVSVRLNRADFRHKYRLSEDALCIGLLPGSRKKEVRMLLPIFLQAAERLQHHVSKPLCFLIPQASSLSTQDLMDNGVREYLEKLDIKILTEDRYELMSSCAAVMATSGTVTLELALLNIPMVVCYKFTFLTYLLGKLLVRGVQRFSLPNLIAGRDVVTELLQFEVNPDRIAAEILKIYKDSPEREKMLRDLADVREKLGEPGASQRAAMLALEMLDKVSATGKSG